MIFCHQSPGKVRHFQAQLCSNTSHIQCMICATDNSMHFLRLLFTLGITWLPASWGSQLLPSITREYPTTHREPGKRSKFKIRSRVSTKCMWVLHHQKVKTSLVELLQVGDCLYFIVLNSLFTHLCLTFLSSVQ